MAKAASKVEEGSQVGTAWPSRQAATMAEDWEKVTAEAEAEKYRHLVAAVDSVGGSGRSPAARWRRARRIARPPYCGGCGELHVHGDGCPNTQKPGDCTLHCP